MGKEDLLKLDDMLTARKYDLDKKKREDQVKTFARPYVEMIKDKFHKCMYNLDDILHDIEVLKNLELEEEELGGNIQSYVLNESYERGFKRKEDLYDEFIENTSVLLYIKNEDYDIFKESLDFIKEESNINFFVIYDEKKVDKDTFAIPFYLCLCTYSKYLVKKYKITREE